jgi:hypothetical protein
LRQDRARKNWGSIGHPGLQEDEWNQKGGRDTPMAEGGTFDGYGANYGIRPRVFANRFHCELWAPPADTVDPCQSRRTIHSKDVTTLAT